MTEEFEKYREMERLFQEASDLAYDDNKIKFVKQRLAELKRDLLSWNDGMIAPTSNAQVTIDTNNVDENEENERVILNPHVTRSRGRPRINRHRSVREITQRANSGRNRNSGRGRRRGRPRNNINSNIAEQVGPHNSQTPGSQTQGNVADAVINPIVSGTIPSHHSIRH
ncbi:hypothetical protein GH714_029692 [Hevea brasiliensis]|uniref:Uncharacterized protein n=1 Tax=Hevea brasiliensis TaxID=3981 RepID=A0A6A6LNJ8_HEVBR|nr:hypothetical protein GH714_029692 [Hevea brasiliensis]